MSTRTDAFGNLIEPRKGPKGKKPEEKKAGRPLLFEWQKQVASDNGPHHTTRHVLLTLSLYSRKDGTGAYPAQRTLAEDTGLGLYTINTHLQLAEHEGWIRRKRRQSERGAHVSPEYQLTFPKGKGVPGNGTPSRGENARKTR